jgi:hypothetical protein
VKEPKRTKAAAGPEKTKGARVGKKGDGEGDGAKKGKADADADAVAEGEVAMTAAQKVWSSRE